MDHEPVTKTLREMLTLEKPKVSYKPESGVRISMLQRSKNSSVQDWPQVNNPENWLGFDAKTLNESYGGILDGRVYTATKVASLHAQAKECILQHEITTPAEVGYLIKWNDTLLRDGLEHGKAHIKQHNGACLQYQVFENEDSIIGCLKGAPLGADHTVKLGGSPNDHGLVVGLGRPSTCFDAAVLLPLGNYLYSRSERNRIHKESMCLLRQLADKCIRTRTRYGYVVTETTLTACRFSDMQSAIQDGAEAVCENDKQMKVEMVRIPWGDWSKDRLTTDLALWWMCMMRLSELEKGPSRVGSQGTSETEQLSHIPNQCNAPMSVVLPPLLDGAMVNQQHNEDPENQPGIGEGDQSFAFQQEDPMMMDCDPSNNSNAIITPAWNPNLFPIQEDFIDTPSNVLYPAPGVMDTDRDQRNWEYERSEGQARLDMEALLLEGTLLDNTGLGTLYSSAFSPFSTLDSPMTIHSPGDQHAH